MAGRKREGIDALKSTTGGKRREDRQVLGKTYFEPITVDAKNVLTVIYLLKSPEDNVMLRAVASLEVFGSKDPENFKLLCSLGIFDYLYPLVSHEDNIVKRFTLKLTGMLCGFEEFREQMLRVDDVLITFVDILRKEMDVVLQEFAALTLAELSKDGQAASELLKVDHCISTLFERLASPDPDIEKNCLEIVNHLLNDINGIDAIVESPCFDLNLILNLTSSHYPTIQALAIEVLKQLTTMCRNQRVLLAFRDAKGIETTLGILENDEWLDLHQGALDLLLNIVECSELCDYLQSAGCLRQLLSLLDNSPGLNFTRRILGIMARMAQTREGATALCEVGMYDRFIDYVMSLEEDDEIIQMHACLGIANIMEFCQSAVKGAKNPVLPLTEIITKSDKSLNLRNLAAYTLNILSKMDKNCSETLMDTGAYKNLYKILLEDSEVSTEICQNIIQVFIGISQFPDLKAELITHSFLSALISCLPSGKKVSRDSSLQVDALECLSEFMTESATRSLFQTLNGADVVLNCLHSKFASVREWAGYVTTIASQNVDFIKDFIRKNGLEWMIAQKNTISAMPTWRSAVESIFSNYLPAKFAYTGRLDFQDITQDGFYIYSNPRSKFVILEELLSRKVSPIVPVYIANFGLSLIGPEVPDSSSQSSEISMYSSDEARPSENAYRSYTEDQGKSVTISDRPTVDYGRHAHIMNDNKIVTLEKCLPDPYLQVYLDTLKRKIEEEDMLIGDADWSYMHPDLIRRRVRTIAKYVDGEMSGPEPDLSCDSPYKEAHLREMKYFLGTNVVPLGAVRMGSYLERALLFKVLADRVGFPCSLVRGSYGRAWIEIAIPVMNIEGFEEPNLNDRLESLAIGSVSKPSAETSFQDVETSRSYRSSYAPSLSGTDECFWFPKISVEDFKCFPREFLKPNAVVDLVTVPGRIFSINSLDAETYCGTFLFCKDTVDDNTCPD